MPKSTGAKGRAGGRRSGSPRKPERKKTTPRAGLRPGKKKRAVRSSSPSFSALTDRSVEYSSSGSGDEDSSESDDRASRVLRTASVLADVEHARVLLTVDDGLDSSVSRTAPSPPPCAVVDGQLASAAGDEVHLWSIASLLQLSPACDETLRPAAVADEPDGELIAGQSVFGRRAGRSSTVTLHNSRMHKLQSSGMPIVAMDASADGTRLAVGDSTGRVFLYSSQEGGVWERTEVVRHPRDGSPATSRGAHRTSSGSRAADAHSSRACCVSLSPDGTKLLTGSKDALRLWSIDDTAGRCLLAGEDAGSGGRNDVVFCAAWCEDNETLAFSHVHTDAAGSRASTVDTLVVTTVTDLSENFARRTGSPSRLQPASDSAHVAAIERRFLRGHEDAVLCCVFVPETWGSSKRGRSEDGGNNVLLLSGSKDGSVRLWNTRSLDCLAVMEGHSDAVTQVRCATEGQTILSASEDGTVRIWDAETCLCFSRLDIGSGDPVRFACFLDLVGTAVLTVSVEPDFRRKFRTSRLDRPQRICAAPAHDSAVRCIAVSPDGLQVATGSQTGGVKIWEIPTGGGAPTSAESVESSCRCIAELHNPEASVPASATTHLHWCADGETLVAANFSAEGDRDPIIRFWRSESNGWQLLHEHYATSRSGASVGPMDVDIAADGSLLSYCGTESDQDYVYIVGLDALTGDPRGRGRDTTRSTQAIGPSKGSRFATVQSAAFSPLTAHSKQHGFLCFFGGLWSVNSGTLLAKVKDREGPMHTLNRCCWSNDGRWVAYLLNASAGSSFHLRLWEVPQDELSASKPPSIAPIDFTGDLADDTHATNFTGRAVIGISFSPDSNALFCACTSWDKHGRLQVYKTSIERSAPDWISVGDVNMGALDSRPWFAPLECDWWTQAFVALPQSSASFAIGTVSGRVQVFDFSGDSDGLRHPEDVLTQFIRGVDSEASLSLLEQKLTDRPDMVLWHNSLRSGKTVLHSAVEEGNIALTSMLLRVYPGASLAAGTSDFGASVLKIAARSPHTDVAELVVSDIIASVQAVHTSDQTMLRSLKYLTADDAIDLLQSHPLLFAKLITSLHPVPGPPFLRSSAADIALGVPKSLPTDVVAASDQLAHPRFWSKYAAELSQAEGGDGIERAIGGDAVILPMRHPWKLLDAARSNGNGIPLLLACDLASEDGGVNAAAVSQFFAVGSFPELLVRQQWNANSSAYAEAAYRHGKLLVCFIISSLIMVDSIVSNEVGATLVSHSRSDWEHPSEVPSFPLAPVDNSTAAGLEDASDDTSVNIGSFIVWLALQPYLLSLWAMDMASVVGRASRGHGDTLLFLSLILLAANGVFDTLLVVSIAYPTGFVIWWDFAVKALTALLLVLRSLLFARGSDVMAVVRATADAILVAVAPAAAVLGALVLGFALTFHTLFSNLDPVHSSLLGSLTATVLALGDTNSLSSQPFSSSPFALVAVPLLYAFIGITVAMLLTIFGIVVRICSDGIPGSAAANLAQERAEIIAYDLWADDTDGQLLVLARTLKMPYDLIFDAMVLLLWKLTELLPWVRVLTRTLPLHFPRSHSRRSTGKQKSRATRGRLPWVHALFGGGSFNVIGDDQERPGVKTGMESHTADGGLKGLSQRLDAEMQERVALSERLEQMSAQMETLIDLVGQSERERRRHSAGPDRQSPLLASRAQDSFTPSGSKGRHSGDRRSSSKDRSSRRSGSSLRLQRAPGEESPPWYSDEEDQQEDDSDDDFHSGQTRRRRAQ